MPNRSNGPAARSTEEPALRHLTSRDYRRMPWRNGGGMTTEIIVKPAPPHAPDRPFLWRVSIADVDSDGPFSTFPGCERIILLLHGKGMRLDAGEQGVIDLDEPLSPRRFSGDWQVFGRLASGPVRDFNVILDRDHASAMVEAGPLEGDGLLLHAGEGETLLLYVVDGALETVFPDGQRTILDQRTRLSSKRRPRHPSRSRCWAGRGL